jgi:hypothetical protein
MNREDVKTRRNPPSLSFLRVFTSSRFILLLLLAGCNAPSDRLSFPDHVQLVRDRAEWFDTNRDGKVDFALRGDEILYDDDQDGAVDRRYVLSDFENSKVPHVILLVDSVPFEALKKRYDAGDFSFFPPPAKMIAPFPSLTEMCFGDIVGAPPLGGMVDTAYNPHFGDRHKMLWKRTFGFEQPWERRMDYLIDYSDLGMSFLKPYPWFDYDIATAKQAIDASPHRVTVIYIATAAAVICKHGQAGADHVLDGIRQLCLQLLKERNGAIKISMMSDHGHNMMPTKNVPLEQWVKAAGFQVRDRIKDNNDVVLELHGLVTVTGIHTRQPEKLAIAINRHPEIQHTFYQKDNRTIIRNAYGTAAIEIKDGRVRYVPIDADPLNYTPVIKQMQAKGVADAEGYADDQAWFDFTVDHEYPNAPRRVWDAFHGKVTYLPDLIITTNDGYCAGRPDFENYITMLSTHGALNQANSAGAIMSMTGRVKGPVQHEQAIDTVEPGFRPTVKR